MPKQVLPVLTQEEAPEPPCPPIHRAAKLGDVATCAELVSAEPACVNEQDGAGYCGLQWAALHNHMGVVKLLLEAGAHVNLVDKFGQAAIHWAVVNSAIPCLELLLRAGGALALGDTKGYTPCHLAAQHGQPLALWMLYSKWNADVDIADHKGMTPLHWASYKNEIPCLRLLLYLDARYLLPDKQGCTALHWAASQGNGEACKVLLQAGAHPCLKLKEQQGLTPPELAAKYGHRLLGFHIEHWRRRRDVRPWYRRWPLSTFTDTALAPLIWAIILALVYFFHTTVLHSYRTDLLTPAQVYASHLVTFLAAAGLFVLYLITVSDPGFVPRGSGGYGGLGGGEGKATRGGFDAEAGMLLPGSAAL